MSRFFNRELTSRELWGFYFFATVVFVYPVIKADYLFFDDNSRILLLDDNLWRDAGRMLAQLFYNALSFSSVTPNVFPLAHFVALPVTALALQALARHYFEHCRLVDCLVVLPLIYCPTLLGILIYQYDGPAVMLGMAATVYAVAYKNQWRGSLILGPAVLIAISLSFYQILLNLLLGLYCVEIAMQSARGASFQRVVKLIARQAVQVVAGLLIYWLTALQFLNTWRSPLLPFDNAWPMVMWTRLSQVADNVSLFINSGNRWLFSVLLLCALLGYLGGACVIFKQRNSVVTATALLVLYVAVVPIMLGVVAGFPLLFFHYGPSARVLLALAPVLVFLMFFGHRFLSALNTNAVWLLLIPLFCMLSFSFMYGRVLMAQKELERSVLYSLAYDINSRPTLRAIRIMYLVDGEASPVRRPASRAVSEKIPALNYLGGGWHRLGESYLVMPDQFPFVGITNVRWMTPADFQAVVVKQQVVDSGFYNIYLSGGDGYIQMKQINSPVDQLPR